MRRARDPNATTLNSNPPIVVRIRQHDWQNDNKGALWHYDFSWDGKRHRGSTEQYDHDEALRTAETEAWKVINAKSHAAAPLTASQARQEYLDDRWPEATRKGNRTYQDFKSRLQTFADFADCSLSTIDADEARALVQRFIKKRRHDHEDGARNLKNFQLVLSRFFRWLITEDKVRWNYNPADSDRLTLPKTEDESPVHLTDSEIKDLLEHSRGKAIHAVIVLCLGAGLRPREATRVKWTDVNFDTGTVRAFGKRRGRAPKMSDWLRQELRQIKPDGATGDVFPHNHFTAFDMFADTRTAAKLGEHVTLQALRSTAAHRAAPQMTTHEYAAYFGHSLAVAQRHYLGYGLDGKGGSVNLQGLDFSTIAVQEVVSQNLSQGKTAKAAKVKTA